MNQASLQNIATLLPISAFLLLLLAQYIVPRRDLMRSGIQRICHNLFLFLVNTLIMRLLVPLTLIGAAAWGAQQDVGLFNAVESAAQLPFWLIVVTTVVLLDFSIYWQHVATHKIPLLWRMHKVHHADHDMDVTTAIRFHPFELLLSLGYKSLIVLALGAPAAAVIIFELLLFVSPAFNHSNLRLPARLDRGLRWIIATPDVHRAHHSIYRDEQDTNYGFFLLWWDRMFRTYTAQPRDGHADMSIGLAEADQACERVDQMLLAPFKPNAGKLQQD